ncbi:hypothetical protein E2C01_072806 [Portunus trituberculatus]|uniref:Uncharacterized protein n=1 Tax=Portunus trituberculatus TaxID=210409 RepID=A0A5B7I3K6_PORTR|nr:hypothetical protein [Portunus trituberculatus]
MAGGGRRAAGVTTLDVGQVIPSRPAVVPQRMERRGAFVSRRYSLTRRTTYAAWCVSVIALSGVRQGRGPHGKESFIAGLRAKTSRPMRCYNVASGRAAPHRAAPPRTCTPDPLGHHPRPARCPPLHALSLTLTLTCATNSRGTLLLSHQMATCNAPGRNHGGSLA